LETYCSVVIGRRGRGWAKKADPSNLGGLLGKASRAHKGYSGDDDDKDQTDQFAHGRFPCEAWRCATPREISELRQSSSASVGLSRLLGNELADDFAHFLLMPNKQVTASVIDDQLCVRNRAGRERGGR
jgi:hypothetical protein